MPALNQDRLSRSRGIEKQPRGVLPIIFPGPGATTFTQFVAQWRVHDQTLEGRRELRRTIGRNEESSLPVKDRVGYTADIVGHNGQAVRGRFEVNEAKSFDAVSVLDARHREDVGSIVNGIQLFVGNIAEKANGEVGLRDDFAQALLIATLALRADHPVLNLTPELWRQALEGLQRDELAFARVETTDGENDDLVFRVRAFFRDNGKIRAQRTRCQKTFSSGIRKPIAQQFLRVIRKGADAGRVANQATGQIAGEGIAVKF